MVTNLERLSASCHPVTDVLLAVGSQDYLRESTVWSILLHLSVGHDLDLALHVIHESLSFCSCFTGKCESDLHSQSNFADTTYVALSHFDIKLSLITFYPYMLVFVFPSETLGRCRYSGSFASVFLFGSGR